MLAIQIHNGIVWLIFGLSEIDGGINRGEVPTPEINHDTDQSKVLTPKINLEIDQNRVLGTAVRFVEKSRNLTKNNRN